MLNTSSNLPEPVRFTYPTHTNNAATHSDTSAESTFLSFTKTYSLTTAMPGGTVTYTISFSNAGPSTATGATAADTFPAALTCTWTSVAAGGATGNTASGSGNISNSLNLQAGSSDT